MNLDVAAVATHELGHAYACLEANLPVYSVSVQAECLSGQTESVSGPVQLTQQQIVGQLVMLMAGQQAVDLLLLDHGHPWVFTAQDDYEIFGKLREDYLSQWPTDGLWLPDQTEAECRARDIVRRYWDKIMDRVVLLGETGTIAPKDL